MKTSSTEFSIRQMIELTGLSEFTIRGWEARYSAFKPRRGQTGRRQYSKMDIERALLMRELLLRGQRISSIANLSHQKLTELFKSIEGLAAASENPQIDPRIQEIIELLSLQRWTELEALLKKMKFRNPKNSVKEFFLPLLGSLTLKSDQGLISIAQEHVFSAMLKERLYSCISDLKNQGAKKNYKQKYSWVLAAPEGDYHEIGLLLAHFLIQAHGFKSLYLGPHTPARDLAETCLRLNSQFVLIVSTISKKAGASSDLLNYVTQIHEKVGPKVKIFLAGSQAPSADISKPTIFKVINNFDAFNNLLESRVTDNE